MEIFIPLFHQSMLTKNSTLYTRPSKNKKVCSLVSVLIGATSYPTNENFDPCL